MAGTCLSNSRPPVRRILELGAHGCPRPQSRAAQNNKIVRLQTRLDHTQAVVRRTDFYPAPFNLIFAVHNQYELATLVRVDGVLRYQNCPVRSADRQPDADEHPRHEKRPSLRWLGIPEGGPHANGARLGIDVVADEVSDPLAWIALFVGQAHQRGHLHGPEFTLIAQAAEL